MGENYCWLCWFISRKNVYFDYDSFSKWIEISSVEISYSERTIRYLRKCFVTHGFLQILVTDNASCFASEEFAVFIKHNNIGLHHITWHLMAVQNGLFVCSCP